MKQMQTKYQLMKQYNQLGRLNMYYRQLREKKKEKKNETNGVRGI